MNNKQRNSTSSASAVTLPLPSPQAGAEDDLRFDPYFGLWLPRESEPTIDQWVAQMKAEQQ